MEEPSVLTSVTWEALVRSTKTWPRLSAHPSLWVDTIDEPPLEELKITGCACAVNGRVVLVNSSPQRLRLVFPASQPPTFCHMYKELWPKIRVARSAEGGTICCDMRWNGSEMLLESRLPDRGAEAAVRDLVAMLKAVAA